MMPVGEIEETNVLVGELSRAASGPEEARVVGDSGVARIGHGEVQVDRVDAVDPVPELELVDVTDQG